MRLLSRALALTLVFGLFAATQALAQQTMPPAETFPTDFTDEELDAFADAYVGIESLQVQYQAEFGEIEDPQEAQAVQQRFQTDAFQVIADSGMTPERYEQIILATQTDPEFAQDLLTRVERAREGA